MSCVHRTRVTTCNRHPGTHARVGLLHCLPRLHAQHGTRPWRIRPPRAEKFRTWWPSATPTGWPREASRISTSSRCKHERWFRAATTADEVPRRAEQDIVAAFAQDARRTAAARLPPARRARGRGWRRGKQRRRQKSAYRPLPKVLGKQRKQSRHATREPSLAQQQQQKLEKGELYPAVGGLLMRTSDRPGRQ